MYSYWNAASANDPASENRSERLLAEPEVRRFTDDLIKRIGLIAPASGRKAETNSLSCAQAYEQVIQKLRKLFCRRRGV